MFIRIIWMKRNDAFKIAHFIDVVNPYSIYQIDILGYLYLELT